MLNREPTTGLRHLKGLSLLCLLALAASSQAQWVTYSYDLQEKQPEVPWIRFPKEPVPQPLPPPPPSPGSVSRIDSGVLYVVDTREDSFYLPDVLGPLHVRELKGPVHVYGKFWDGKGDEELRQYDGKKVYIVTAKGTGVGTLVIVRVGAQGLADTSSRRLEANLGPKPPPNPDPDPKPKPKPDPTPDKLGFIALAKTQAQVIPEASRGLASSLASNFDSIASKLAATNITIDQANAELRDKNRAALGDHRAAWLPWFQAWQVQADKHNAAGTMTTKEHYIAAYQETAAGLRAVR